MGIIMKKNKQKDFSENTNCPSTDVVKLTKPKKRRIKNQNYNTQPANQMEMNLNDS